MKKRDDAMRKLMTKLELFNQGREDPYIDPLGGFRGPGRHTVCWSCVMGFNGVRET